MIFQQKIGDGRAGVHNEGKALVKVLFSDNNSDVFEWNWLIYVTLIDIYVRYCTTQEL